MGCIQVDKKLQKSEEMANFFLFLLNEDRVKLPRLSLFQILLGKFRPGLDSSVISSSILSRFEEAGIPSGPLEGGQPNVMESYTQIVVEEIVDAIQTDMRVDTAVDPGMTVTSTGANAGGPVVSVGANVAPHSATGLAT
jgi:hypothetical protein